MSNSRAKTRTAGANPWQTQPPLSKSREMPRQNEAEEQAKQKQVAAAIPSELSAAEASNETYRHSVFITNLGATEQSEIFTSLSKYDQVLDIVIKEKDGRRFGFVTFAKTKTVESLTEQGTLIIAGQSVRCHPYKPTVNWSQKESKIIEKTGRMLESLQRPSAGKNIQFHLSRPKGLVSDPVSVGEEVTTFIKITNSGPDINFINIDRFGYHPEFYIDVQGSSTRKWINGSLLVQTNQSHTVKVTFKPKSDQDRAGLFSVILLFRFQGFAKSLQLEILVSNSKDLAMLQPTSQPQLKDHYIDDAVRKTIPAGVSSSNLGQTVDESSWLVPLNEYNLPEAVQRDIDAKDKYGNVNPWNLKNNYRKRMHDLLWIEEAHQRKFIRWPINHVLINSHLPPASSSSSRVLTSGFRHYDKQNIEISVATQYTVNDGVRYVQDKSLSRIYIPGLSEKRPSVLPGDLIISWIPGTTDVEYEGVVFRVEYDALLVNFCKDFHSRFPTGQKFNIRFAFSRLPLRIMHRAVDQVDMDITWPSAYKPTPLKFASMDALTFFDSQMSDNTEQKTSIWNILNKVPKTENVPYLICGPFGTGKTRTLIEAVRQVLQHRKGSRILLCTPSNSACDKIGCMLAQILSPTEVFRLYTTHRQVNTVPAVLLPFSSYDKATQQFVLPTNERICQYDVVLTTSTTASTLVNIGIGPSHFTHIFLDEAAQMMEAEAIIPLSLATKTTVIVMSGDEKQLGAQVQSAKNQGIEKSIMERLLTHNLLIEMKTTAISRLFKNYRTHPVLLDMPSKLFYGSTLQALAPAPLVNGFLSWEKLPNPKFPFLFCGIQGEDMREGDSPSFFNRHEAITVADLVQNLCNQYGTDTKDIGIISPFYKQVHKIRMLLRERRLGYISTTSSGRRPLVNFLQRADLSLVSLLNCQLVNPFLLPTTCTVELLSTVKSIKVGSIAEFQGQECKVLFISTVRSSRHWLSYDEHYGLGLFNQPRTLNTALTRVAAMLVVVGDPYVLKRDENWNQILNYCMDNGSYTGPVLTPQYYADREEADKPPADLPILTADGDTWKYKDEELILKHTVKAQEAKENPSHSTSGRKEPVTTQPQKAVQVEKAREDPPSLSSSAKAKQQQAQAEEQEDSEESDLSATSDKVGAVGKPRGWEKPSPVVDEKPKQQPAPTPVPAPVQQPAPVHQAHILAPQPQQAAPNLSKLNEEAAILPPGLANEQHPQRIGTPGPISPFPTGQQQFSQQMFLNPQQPQPMHPYSQQEQSLLGSNQTLSRSLGALPSMSQQQPNQQPPQKNDPSFEFECLLQYRNFPLISVCPHFSSSPPMSIYDQPTQIIIEICVFGIHVLIDQQQNPPKIELTMTSSAQLPNAIFHIPVKQIANAVKLLILIPDGMDQNVEIEKREAIYRIRINKIINQNPQQRLPGGLQGPQSQQQQVQMSQGPMSQQPPMSAPMPQGPMSQAPMPHFFDQQGPPLMRMGLGPSLVAGAVDSPIQPQNGDFDSPPGLSSSQSNFASSGHFNGPAGLSQSQSANQQQPQNPNQQPQPLPLSSSGGLRSFAPVVPLSSSGSFGPSGSLNSSGTFGPAGNLNQSGPAFGPTAGLNSSGSFAGGPSGAPSFGPLHTSHGGFGGGAFGPNDGFSQYQGGPPGSNYGGLYSNMNQNMRPNPVAQQQQQERRIPGPLSTSQDRKSAVRDQELNPGPGNSSPHLGMPFSAAGNIGQGQQQKSMYGQFPGFGGGPYSQSIYDNMQQAQPIGILQPFPAQPGARSNQQQQQSRW